VKRLATAFASVGEVVILGFRTSAVVVRRPFEWGGVARQIYLQGIRGLGLMFVMSAFAGLVLGFQFGQSLDRFGARQYIGQLTGVALAREMMPVLTALVIGGRIVAGIAAELASMAVTEQIDAVRAMGADPVKKLVMPRVIATTLVIPIFCILGDVIGSLAGMLVARMEFSVPFRFYLYAMRDFMVVGDFLSGVGKSAVFGLAGGLIACRAGTAARGGTEGVGRATTNAVVAASLTVIVLDYLLTRIFFLGPRVR
jgi:phospholipid/cholesterol/gamma-HCH transport system permease protein